MKKEEKFTPITIDRSPKKPVEPVTGIQLYQLAGVSDQYDLYLEAKGPGDDTLVERSSGVVDIRPGDHFYSAQSSLNPGA